MTTTPLAGPQRTCRRADGTATFRPAAPAGNVLHQRITVAPRRRGAPPRHEDALRVGVMRRIAAAKLNFCGLGDLVGDVMLIVSELWTNALLHTSTTEITLRLEIEDGYLRVTVEDGEPGSAAPQHHDNPDAETGRGLLLVQHLVEEHGGAWGTGKGGAETWCTLALPAGTAA
ncbi:ATP-binding protein [Streptomyces sp. NPDC057382]|uniref:ATP-binding protein n=1 Tax=unclassified Streptomyces TaxID=2593676 RepID=UPI00362C9977